MLWKKTKAKKRSNRKRRINNRRVVFIFSLILIFILIFKTFPQLGVYAYFFDNDDYIYAYAETSTSENISNLDELSPKTRGLANKFLERCEEEGLSVRITETYRTQERQDMLYEQGRITPGPVVTWTRNSKHSSRRAFDICEDNTDDPYGDLEFFRKCAEIGKEVGLTPGYYFEGSQDMPHYELNRWWLP